MSSRRQFIAGMASAPAAQRATDELHARCLVLDDGQTRLAIVICDNTMIHAQAFDRAKALVEQCTGLAANRMLMAATHTHSAPRTIGISHAPADRNYEEFLVGRIADCVCIAINNLAPATIGWGIGRKPEYVFNRRWIMKAGTIPPDPFGGTTDRARMNPGKDAVANLVESAGPVDPEVSVVSVQRLDGRPLALLANYGLHYVGEFVSGEITADYYGFFAARVAELIPEKAGDQPFVGIMSNGTSGDVARQNRQAPEPAAPPYQRMRQVADGVAEEVARICRGMDHRESARLAMRETELELGVRRPGADRLAWARKLAALAEGKKNLTRPEIYARETLLLSEYPATVKLKLQALRIGEMGVAAIPCEVFAETGLAIKAQSALKPAFVIELANGYGGYLPTARQHELGGYETWAARSSFLEVSAEEKIRSAVLSMLRQV